MRYGSAVHVHCAPGAEALLVKLRVTRRGRVFLHLEFHGQASVHDNGHKTSIVNALPVASQVKSLVFFCCGNAAEARRVQVQFSQQCPVVSQCRSMVELLLMRSSEALATQRQQLRLVAAVSRILPVVGHAYGTAEILLGRRKEGISTLNHATRTSLVVGATLALSLAVGPFAPLFGVATMVAYDFAHTVVTKRKQGLVAAWGRLLAAKSTTDEVFDVCVGLAITAAAVAAGLAMDVSKVSMALADGAVAGVAGADGLEGSVHGQHAGKLVAAVKAAPPTTVHAEATVHVPHSDMTGGCSESLPKYTTSTSTQLFADAGVVDGEAAPGSAPNVQLGHSGMSATGIAQEAAASQGKSAVFEWVAKSAQKLAEKAATPSHFVAGARSR